MKLTVVNESGKQAVVAILGPGDFSAKVPCRPARLHDDYDDCCTTTVLVIERTEMIRVLHGNMSSPTVSSLICWHETFEWKRI